VDNVEASLWFIVWSRVSLSGGRSDILFGL
jgi:hypothetical protein